MVIDVIHPGQDRVRGQHRGGGQALHRDGVGAVGERGQLRPDGPQVRQRAQPGQRPRISGGQVLELLQGRLAQREARADRRQQRHAGGLPAAAARICPAPARPAKACSSIAPAYRHDLAGDARPGRRRAVTGPAAPVSASASPGVRGRPGLRHALPPRFRFRCRPGSRLRRLRHARSRLRRILLKRQLALRAGRAEMAQHRGLVHPQAAGDLRIAHPDRPPLPRLVPRCLAGMPSAIFRRSEPRPPNPR